MLRRPPPALSPHHREDHSRPTGTPETPHQLAGADGRRRNQAGHRLHSDVGWAPPPTPPPPASPLHAGSLLSRTPPTSLEKVTGPTLSKPRFHGGPGELQFALELPNLP